MQNNEEHPVKQPGPTTINRNMAVAAVAALVAVIVAGILLWPESTADEAAGNDVITQTDPVDSPTTAGATGDTDASNAPAATVDPAAPAAAANPDAVPLAREAAGSWTVVGTDNLNIRQAPGTSNEVIGTLDAGQGGIEATGERVTVSGAEWKQIQFGEAATLGWVSALYLAPESGSPAPVVSESTLCFQSGEGGRQIALQLDRTSSGQTWSGIMREDSGTTTSYDLVNGTGAGPSIEVIITDTADNSERTATWTLDGQSLVFMDGTPVRVVPCAAIAGLLPAT